ncbi:MAG: uracil-DNA glycosylase family protein [Cellvibrionaceae bacterium]
MTHKFIASTSLDQLVDHVKRCDICEAHLPFGPRPVVQLSSNASLLIIGQAPGRRVHETGIPWNDPSGDRLRMWLGLSREQFYDATNLAIMPMGFCYPGTGKTGDLPPRKECAEQWHESLLSRLNNVKLTLLIGQYAQRYYLARSDFNNVTQYKKNQSLTDTVRMWDSYLPNDLLPLPHPSPRNQLWLKKNAWFEHDVLPVLKERVQTICS